MPTPPADERARRIEQTADRLAESAARLVLGLVPGAGPFLAEAVSFARTFSDDADAADARAVLSARLGDLTQRLAAVEATGVGFVKITDERAQVLAVALRYANGHVVGYCDADETIQELGLTADVYREAVQELDHLEAVTSYVNGNHASGYGGVSVTAATFVALVGQVVPGVVAERELGELLAVFRRAANDQWVARSDFEALSIPPARELTDGPLAG